jgi:large subunit ribosomal protein L4
MLKVDLYNQEGQKKGEVSVPEEIFGQEFNRDLIHQALLRQAANARLGFVAHTLTKGEVSGGGKKPFRQKGTGNARQGSTRNPHWRHGGVAFGPRNNRNYKQDMPKKQRRLALFSALSAKMKENKIIALDSYTADKSKTKPFVEMLHRLPIETDVLIVIPSKNAIIEKSSNNLPFVKTLMVNYLNIADLQKYDHILFFEEALKKMEEVFLQERKKREEKKKPEGKKKPTAKAAKS